MEFAGGLAVAYLQIVLVAVAIMVGVWGAAKIWLAFYNRMHPPGDGGGHE
ncbi:MAG: hypothetical protein HQ512_12595 [Rhodospirillales bacterium]|nr:hypothetical protein [Rhodospirillales bacterium]